MVSAWFREFDLVSLHVTLHNRPGILYKLQEEKKTLETSKILNYYFFLEFWGDWHVLFTRHHLPSGGALLSTNKLRESDQYLDWNPTFFRREWRLWLQQQIDREVIFHEEFYNFTNFFSDIVRIISICCCRFDVNEFLPG